MFKIPTAAPRLVPETEQDRIKMQELQAARTDALDKQKFPADVWNKFSKDLALQNKLLGIYSKKAIVPRIRTIV